MRFRRLSPIAQIHYDLGRFAAPYIQAGSYVGLTCTGESWFRILIGQGGSLVVTIQFLNTDGDLDLALVSEAGQQIAQSQGTGNSEQVACSGLVAGTYFIKVFGYNGAQAQYSLIVATA
ncbi:MAG: PPC domain-containing protein [Alphaproteobacteria bacterium]|nr:PPC domain-containing protein [Alphaproteobacteria bacterium]